MAKRTEAEARAIFDRENTKRTEYEAIKRSVVDVAVKIYLSDSVLVNLVRHAYHKSGYSIEDIGIVLKAFLKSTIYGVNEEVVRGSLSDSDGVDQKSQCKLFDEFRNRSLQARLLELFKEVKQQLDKPDLEKGREGPWIVEGICQSQEFAVTTKMEEIPCLEETEPLLYEQIDKIITNRQHAVPIQFYLNGMVSRIRQDLAKAISQWDDRYILLEHTVSKEDFALYVALAVLNQLAQVSTGEDDEISLKFANLPSRKERLSTYLNRRELQSFSIIPHPHRNEILFLDKIKKFIIDQVKINLPLFISNLDIAARAAFEDIREIGKQFENIDYEDLRGRIARHAFQGVEKSFVEFQLLAETGKKS